MKVSALEEYGLRCMLLLAANNDKKPLTLPEISVKEGVSVPYAGKLLMILKKAELVKASRGRNGGYVLSRDPSEIYLKDIFNALGKPVYSADHCGRFSGDQEVCVHTSKCLVQNIWKTFDNFIDTVLTKVTLIDLVKSEGDLNSILDIQKV